MAVSVETTAVRYEDISAGTPISVPFPLYEALDVKVYYGAASLVAVYNTDYTIALGDDFDTFTLVPLASLLTKINALISADPTEENYITVRRELDYKTDTTDAAVRYTPFTSREFERTAMRFQQISERLNRAVTLSPNFVGDAPLVQLGKVAPNAVLLFNADGTAITTGPTVGQIQSAEAGAQRAETAADAAEADAAIAASAKTDAVAARTVAQAARDGAESARDGAIDARNDTIIAAEAIGNVVYFDTKADADTGAGALPDQQVVEVFADETQFGLSTRYRKEGGSLVFKLALWSSYRVNADIQITVGSGGDCATINEALALASRYETRYKYEGVTVEIRLLSGFVMNEQVFVFHKDMSYCTITSEDWDDTSTPVTIVRSAMTGVPTGKVNWRTGVFPAFTAMSGAGLPTIGCLFEFDTSGTGEGSVGVLIKENSHGLILRTCGVKNAGWRGLYVDHGLVYARQTVWDGAGGAGGVAIAAGIRISNGAIGNVRESSAKNCAVGLYANNSTVIALSCDFSGAVADANNAIHGTGIHLGASAIVGAEDADCSGADKDGVSASAGSMLYADGIDCSGVGGNALQAYDGGEIHADGADCSDAGGRAINTYVGGRVFARSANCDNAADRAVSASNSSFVNIPNATITNCGVSDSVRLYGGSEVNLADAVVDGNVKVSDGDRVNLSGALTSLGGFVTANVPRNEFTEAGLVYGKPDGVGADRGDVSGSLGNTAEPIQIFATALTNTRSAVLPDPSLKRRIRIVRTEAAVDSTTTLRLINVQYPGGTTLWTLQVGDWAEFEPNKAGTAWLMVAKGSVLVNRKSVSADKGNASLVLLNNCEPVQLFNTALSAHRSVALPDPRVNREITIVRGPSATGAFTLYIQYPNGTGIATLDESDTWVRCAPNNAADGWVIVARGRGTQDRDIASADNGDNSFTAAVNAKSVQFFNTPLTTNRGIVLPDPDIGRPIRVVRGAGATDSGGTRSLNVNYPDSGTTLKSLAVGQWADFHPTNDKTGWILTAHGSL